MKSGFVSIMKKELTRFFTDRRLVLMTVIVPGLLIYLIYSFMGMTMSSNLSVDANYQPKIYAENLPTTLGLVFAEAGLEFEAVDAEGAQEVKKRVAAKEADLLVVFPPEFESTMINVLADSAGAPNIEVFYNSTRVESGTLHGQVQNILSAYKEAIRPVFTVNAGEEAFDLASREDAAGYMFGALLPMLLMIFLFSGCMSVAPESIAGEKERGTIATLLVTPLKRWELALGKVVSLCFIALLSGASSFIGVMLSLPNLLQLTGSGGAGEGTEQLVDASLYSMQDYLMLLAVILSTVLLFVGLVSLVSAFARSTKEASTMVMPLMVIVLFAGASAMFQSSSVTEPLLYLVPVYNSVQSMVAIFGFSADLFTVALTVATNCVAAGLCVVALTRMFESERIIFSK